MTNKFTHGQFVWRELATSDPKKAAAFYSELFGWKITETDMGGGFIYRLVHLGDRQIAGIWTAEKGMPTFWGGYISVDDVDAAAKRASAAGGSVFKEPADIPNVGRFAVVCDGQRAVTMPFKSAQGDPEKSARPGPGEFCWESLGTTNAAAAKEFYTKVYGWEVKEFAPGMPYFAAGDAQVASFMEDAKQHPAWMSYVAVAKLGEARDRAKRLGATIIAEEIPVPGIGKFAVIQDPQGAFLSLFEGTG